MLNHVESVSKDKDLPAECRLLRDLIGSKGHFLGVLSATRLEPGSNS